MVESSSQGATEKTGEGRPEHPPRRGRTFLVALAGSLLLFLAQPPVGWSWLGWLAPCPWLWLAMRPSLAGRRPYLQIWLAGMVYWLLALHWIRLAHPATCIGLVFLAGYLAIYLPLFIALVRRIARQHHLPIWMNAPLVWVGLEYVQGYLLGGFLMGTLGQTQVNQTALIQISDLGGAYMVSLLVMLVASCSVEIVTVKIATAWIPAEVRPPKWKAIAAGVLLVASLAGTLGYGQHQLAQADSPANDTAPQERRIALVQGNFRAVWTSDPGRDKRVMDSYLQLSRQAVDQANRQGRPIDLMVWPEGMFRSPLFTYDEGFDLPEPSKITPKQLAQYGRSDLAAMVRQLGTPILVGLDRRHAFPTTKSITSLRDYYHLYNSAAAVDRSGELLGTYDKRHLVMFGEYVPGGSWWPGIYQFFPVAGLTPGQQPRAFEIEGVRYMPTICYETVLPHAVRGQVAKLAAAGERPDVLVNMTNDSWFNDSSELQMHLTCSRFRAIECRTPMVVAANGGLSAHIDRYGRVQAVSEPMAEQCLLVDVSPGGGSSLYLRLGDFLAGGCLIATALLAMIVPFRPLFR